MRIKMKLFNQLIRDMIHSGVKTVELRLMDEKRAIIKVGDEIEFIYLLSKNFFKKHLLWAISLWKLQSCCATMFYL